MVFVTRKKRCYNLEAEIIQAVILFTMSFLLRIILTILRYHYQHKKGQQTA